MIFISFSKAENAAPGCPPPSLGWNINERGAESMGRGLPREEGTLVIPCIQRHLWHPSADQSKE